MNDSSIMFFGKHKGVKLANVPAGYLIFLYENKQHWRTDEEKQLEQYIADNLAVLQHETKN